MEPAASTPAAGKPKRKKRRDPVANDVYIKGGEHRRVVAVGEYFHGIGDEAQKIARVCYSIGRDVNRWCNLQTFRTWMSGATLASTTDESKILELDAQA